MDPTGFMSSMPSITGGDARSDAASDLFNRTDISFSSPFIVGGSGGGIAVVVAVLGVAVIGALVWLLKK